MFEQVKGILSEFVEVSESEILLESNLISDLGLNSFDVINIIVIFEETFDIEIEDRDIRNFVTVSDIIEYLEENQA